MLYLSLGPLPLSDVLNDVQNVVRFSVVVTNGQPGNKGDARAVTRDCYRMRLERYRFSRLQKNSVVIGRCPRNQLGKRFGYGLAQKLFPRNAEQLLRFLVDQYIPTLGQRSDINCCRYIFDDCVQKRLCLG